MGRYVNKLKLLPNLVNNYLDQLGSIGCQTPLSILNKDFTFVSSNMNRCFGWLEAIGHFDQGGQFFVQLD